jgi:predicted ArsR family transcriptional regulator
MSTLQEEARALGDPTRHSIFRYLADAGRPVGVAELTAHLELNHNAVRQHLAKLLDAALVTETRAASGRPGRPRLVYSVDPSADSRWGVIGPYERLSLLLAEVIRTGDSPLEVGRRAAERHPVAPSPAEDAVGDISAAMAREGFDPEVRRGRQRVDIILRTCPFETAAVADVETVCSLHLGIAEGLAENTDVVVDALIAKDPRRANCRLHLRVTGSG